MNSGNGGNYNVGKYIGIYFGIGMGYSALMLFQTLLLWIFCSVEVSDRTWFCHSNELT